MRSKQRWLPTMQHSMSQNSSTYLLTNMVVGADDLGFFGRPQGPLWTLWSTEAWTKLSCDTTEHWCQAQQLMHNRMTKVSQWSQQRPEPQVWLLYFHWSPRGSRKTLTLNIKKVQVSQTWTPHPQGKKPSSFIHSSGCSLSQKVHFKNLFFHLSDRYVLFFSAVWHSDVFLPPRWSPCCPSGTPILVNPWEWHLELHLERTEKIHQTFPSINCPSVLT